MSALAEKIRRAREFKVPAGGITFVMRRPTDVEWMELAGQSAARAAVRFIVGWEGVREIDLIPGGDPHPLPFDAAACEEFVTDRIDLLTELSSAFVKRYEEHLAKREGAAKN